MKMKNTQKIYRLSLGRRIIAALVSFVMLAQICAPGIAAAAILITDDQIASEIMSNYQFQPSLSRDHLYEQAAYFNQTAAIQNKTIANFHKDLVTAKAGLPKPTYIPIAGDITVILPVHILGKVIGDAYVQNRYIRSQITDLLGRHMIDTAAYSTELSQINSLYANAFTFAKNNTSGYVFGKKIAEDFVISQDMIWPELRTINGQQVLVPIVYLTDNTLNTRGVKDHTIEFAGTSAQFANIILDKTTLLARRNAFIQTMGDIVNAGGTISGQQNLTLAVGGTLKNISGNISADKNLSIIAGQIYNKTQVHPFTDKNGSGTRLGEVAGFDSANGNISLESYSDIIFEGANATASNGSISFNAANNIVIAGLATQYQGTGKEGDWRINKSSVDIFQSRLSAQETISLIAGGSITISASELTSTKGGIELLAKQGIYVLNEFGQTYVKKEDKKGKTKGTASDFETWAIRSVLNAGKGVLIYTDEGDITLKGTKINSVDGTNVTAKNGKVHLLVAKEQSQHYLNTVRKGTWTVKTVNEEYIEETAVPNAIIGGFAVEALHGVEVEYTGKEGATLAEQIREYEKMPEMAWMATLYKDPTIQANWEQIELEYKRIRKSKTSLSPAAMAIIAIACAVAMGPAGAGLIGTGGTITAAGPILGPVLAAGATTLVTQAVSSVAAGNNLNETLDQMSSSESLRSLAISMATAGAMQYAQLDKVSMFKDAAANANPLISLSAQAAQVVVDATVSAGISVTINGGNSDDYLNSFKASLATGAINKIGAKMANKIKLLASGPAPKFDEAMRYIAHAGLGCALGVASAKTGGSDADVGLACGSGAGGAVIGEWIADEYSEDKMTPEQKEVVEWLESHGAISEEKFNALSQAEQEEFIRLLRDNPVSLDDVAKLKEIGTDLAKLGAGLAAFASGADVNIAANAAENAVENNALSWASVLTAITTIMLVISIYDTLEKIDEKWDEYGTLKTQVEKDAFLIQAAIDLGIDISIDVAASYTGTKLIHYLYEKAANKPAVKNLLSRVYDKDVAGIDHEMAGEKNTLNGFVDIYTSRLDLHHYVKDYDIKLKEGWNSDRLYDEVLSKSPSERTLKPEDYLAADYIASNLSKFNSGVVRVTTKKNIDEYSTLANPASETFVLPKSEWDRIAAIAQGDPKKLEVLLGLDFGDLGTKDNVYAVLLDEVDVGRIGLPDGLEVGANGFWIPGGKTSGGVIEGLMNIPASAIDRAIKLDF